ncbi:unnamed protein product [Soboliphyme baturini]|uniref:Cyclin-dependent kinase 2-associated protein 1 n=1 Tax=Soboliphyme baturini TaxID=241478 RepID=A0A183IA26_9BILA|nr:unnamed protein product [Soboliphyme baturini]
MDSTGAPTTTAKGSPAASTATISDRATIPRFVVPQSLQPHSKYDQLLAVIEEIGKDIRPTYAGNKNSAERLKHSIVHARILVRDCFHEVKNSSSRS